MPEVTVPGIEKLAEYLTNDEVTVKVPVAIRVFVGVPMVPKVLVVFA